MTGSIFVNPPFFPFPKPLVLATFVARPQRFLAEMELSDGSRVIAYCANPGSLSGCLEPGSPALLWDSCNPKRKRQYTWRAIKIGETWVGTDTHLANNLVELGLTSGFFLSLGSSMTFTKEKKISDGLRLDFELSTADGPIWIEVKSATIVENGIARFPDSVTPRGIKHLRALTKVAHNGGKAALIFVVQRDDAKAFTINCTASEYVDEFIAAIEAGVVVYALSTNVSIDGITLMGFLNITF